VQSFEPAHDLNEVVPYLGLRKLESLPLLVIDQLEHVAAIRVLHDDAEAVGGVLEEGLLVANDVDVVDGSEDADFV